MKVIQIYINNILKNFNYILYSEKNKHAIVFDPYSLELIEKECEKYEISPKYLLNTHYHFDHIKDNKALLKKDGCSLLELNHLEEFKLSESEKIVCRYTPGHVSDHKCFYLYNNDILNGVICGDTVFNSGVGNCKNGGNPEDLYRTIKNDFYSLPDNVLIYPSHDYFETNLKFAKSVDPHNSSIDEYLQKVQSERENEQFSFTSIGEEKLYNPFFRVFDEDFQKQHNKEEKELFIYLRSLRDKW